MKKHFILLGLLFFTYILIQANLDDMQDSEAKLFIQGFENELDIEGFRPFVVPFALEVFVTYEKGRRLDYNFEYKWIDGNILYQVIFLTKDYPNTCVFAYILEDDSYEIWLDSVERAQVRIVTVEDDSRFGEYAGRTFAVSKPFYKVNENDEPASMIVNINGEERYIWF
ncbi:MAG: hypothetical protein FWD28_04985 [Treponema sp.]|nr:hypothetical protein [Treponema sp.]